MLTTAGPTLSTKSVKSGRLPTDAADAGTAALKSAGVKRAPAALRINAVIVFLASWIVFMGSLFRRLEFNRIGDLFNCHGRNFTYDSKPKITLTLADDVHCPLLQGAFGAAISAWFDKHRNSGQTICFFVLCVFFGWCLCGFVFGFF